MKRSGARAAWPTLIGLAVLAQMTIFAEPALSQEIEVSATSTELVERLAVNVINVDAFVVDKKGRPVTDLTAGDFTVLEDGKRVELTHFAPGAGLSGAPGGASPGEAGRSGAPAHFVILVDNYAIDPQSRKLLLGEVRTFVESGLEPGDRVAVASYEGHLEMRQSFTADRALVLAAIDGLENPSAAGIARQKQREAELRDLLRSLRSIEQRSPQEGGAEASARRLSTTTQQVAAYSRWVRSEVMDTFQEMSHLVNSLAAIPGRKALVYVSEGLSMRPGEEMYFAIQDSGQRMAPLLGDMRNDERRNADLDLRSGQLDSIEQGAAGRSRRQNEQLSIASGLNELAALANSSQVSFYNIKTVGGGAAGADLEGDLGALYTPQMINVKENNLNETLRVMAESTGGDASIGGDLQAFLKGAHDDFSSHYSLAYSPAHDGDGKYHEIEVKVRRRGTRIRHRAGYLDKPFGAKLADLTTAALLFDFGDNPVGISVSTGASEPGPEEGQRILTVVVEVPLDEVALLPQDGGRVGDTQILVAVREPNGRSTPVQEMALRIEIPADRLEEAAGAVYPAELRLLMREGAQRIAIGFVDPVAGTVSLITHDVVVGPGQ